MVSTSPGLIAAAHVLHRLSAPRHPPCALVLLIEKNTYYHYGVFKVRARTGAGNWATGAYASEHPSFKTQQRVGRGRRNSRRDRSPDDQTNDHQRAGQPTGVSAPGFPRKEVIQPQLPLRLPCYDFTPVTNPTFGGCLRRAVSTPTSGVAGFRGVTGGVYKARERIHRGVADPRLLATPPSWRRVSASNPNRDRLFGIRSPSRVCSPLYRPM